VVQVSKQRMWNKGGVPSSSEGYKARLMRPWCSRVPSHGTLLTVSAQVCASGRHPRPMPLRLRFDLVARRVPRVSGGALQPSSQLPTFDSENLQEQCGSELS